MKDKLYPFELVANQQHQVVIKNIAKSPIDVAMFPYVSADIDYITISKGDNHNCTIVKTDGMSWSFHWGKNGYTMVADIVEQLKANACEYVTSKGICINANTQKQPNEATIFYNPNFKKWQAQFKFADCSQSHNYWSNTANNENEMLEEIRHIFNDTFGLLEHKVASTGIDTWKCVALKSLYINPQLSSSTKELYKDVEDEKGTNGLWDKAGQLAVSIGLYLQENPPKDNLVFAEEYGQELIYNAFVELCHDRVIVNQFVEQEPDITDD